MATIVVEDTAEYTVTRDTVTGVDTLTYKPGTKGANIATLMQRAGVARTNNDAFLAIGSPTNAQGLAQIQALTRQVNGIMRFILADFGDVSDA